MSNPFRGPPIESAPHPFWQKHLDGLDASHFPPLPSHLTKPRPDSHAELRVAAGLLTAQQQWSNVTLCRAALTVLLSGYTNSPEVIFGVAVQKSHTLKKSNGVVKDKPPSTAVVPLRVFCEPSQPISDIIAQITAHEDALTEFQDSDLSNIGPVGEAALFQTVLRVADGDAPREPHEVDQVGKDADRTGPFTSHALVLNYQTTDESTRLEANYDHKVIDGRQIDRFLRQLGSLIQQFQTFTADTPPLQQLQYVTPEDQAEIESWNSNPLEALDITIHGVIAQRTAEFPDAAAIMAWDGEWTYNQLDQVSSCLAAYIVSLDIPREQVFVPLCFEKSKWVIAAMLAVLKAGRAFALIDPNDPPARMTQICRQTGATVALTSQLHSDRICAIVGRCIVVDNTLLQSVSQKGAFELPAVKAEDLAYVLFTSGSTGKPKGNAIEHRGYGSCSSSWGPLIGMNRRTRSLQFASYAFGACLVEIVTTLMHGGCVCIPSDHDRMNDIPGYLKRCKVNWMVVATSYLNTLRPEDVPGVETMVAGGEPLSALARDTWASKVHLVNVYGQSESSTISSITRVKPSAVESNNVGRGVGSRTWIIDTNDPTRLVPVGCIGELVIESPGIARGCLTEPGAPLDTSPFLNSAPVWYPYQLSKGVKFYRTGDLARYSADGSVVCLGRRDNQIKIRGQRIEMSEVETRLRQQLPNHVKIVADGIKRSTVSRSTVLVAFLIEPNPVKDADACPTSMNGAHILNQVAAKDINRQLQQVLPKQSLPSYYIRMEELPRTATGKVDRRVLRSVASKLLDDLAQNVASGTSANSNGEATSTASKLREMWSLCLNLDRDAGPSNANFFELGGDSIAAIKMVNMARLAEIELTVSDIFQNPTLAALTKIVTDSSTTYSPIPKSKHTEHAEQSFAQGRLWFLDQLEVGASWYLIPYGVRIRGPLNVKALTASLLALEQRHETLRTTFEERGGAGVQIVHPGFFKELKVIDMTGERDDRYLEVLEHEQTAPFNVALEAGWRATLIRLGQDDHILSIVMHHIISDGWSIDVLRREVSQFYSAALRGLDPLAVANPLPITYRDFSVWQKLDEQEAEHQRQLEYWIEKLADSTPAEFLTDLPRPSILTGKAGSAPVVIEGDLYTKLRNFCNLHEMTFFSVLLAAFRATHYRLTGAEDSVIGTPIANRSRGELEDIIGFFVNTQCVRTTIEEHDTFESVVRQVHGTVTAALEHQDVPFERVVSALLPGSRDVSRNPLAQVIFAMHSQKDLRKFDLEGLETEAVANHIFTRFDIELHLFQETGSVSGYMAFAEDLFKLENVQNIVNVFLQILSHGLDQPKTRISVLPLTVELEELREKGLLGTKKVEYPRESSVVDVFRSQVEATPDNIAVVDSSSRLTYAELDHKSDQLAAWLRHRNMAPETAVGILASRSYETVIAILGVLKANLAYLPLDVKWPTSRLAAIFSALPNKDKLLLAGSDVNMNINLPDVQLVRISEAVESNSGTNGYVNGNTGSSAGPIATSLAYVIFTSGSTGKPKGVMTEHRAIVRLAKGTTVMSKLPSSPKVAHMTNLAFDVAVGETFTALLNGGTLVCIDYMTILDSNALEAVFAQEQVNVAMMTPALLKQCLAYAPGVLRRLLALFVAGDRFDPKDAIAARELIPSNLFNAYGPTENGVLSTIYTTSEEDEPYINGVPIGQAVDNSGVLVMDPQQQLVPAGVMGELVVIGDGLARGYTDPTLDTGRFVKLNLDGQIVRAYRTGDRVRYRIGDGKIEFFGRMDQQIKIRGHRIETAEVERAILNEKSVQDAVVVVRDVQGQDPEMVGFVVAKDDRGDATQQDDEADNQVKGWQDLFETNTYADLDTVSPSATGNDFTGWKSTYTGEQIDKNGMQEWLDDTMSTLLDGQKPGRVFEIGTGTGMVLFNLGPLQSYVGLEPSKSATLFVNRAIESVPTLAGRAQVHVGTATDIDKIGNLHPDLVVVNSVAQYFPTPEYLIKVVDALIRMPGVKRLFFGDVRSLATNKHFLAARAVHSLGNEATKDQVLQRMSELEEREEEMLVDPAFFTALQRRLPHLIKHVEIIPKNMRATNELSAYRYAAVIHGHEDDEPERRPVHSVNKSDWINFQASGMNSETLLNLLKRSADSETFSISNIPYSKTIFERHVVESLESEGRDDSQNTPDGAAWISAVRAGAKQCPSLDVSSLIQLGKDAGFRVEVSAARQGSQHGALDAIFHRYDSSSRVLFHFPTDDETARQSNPAAFINRPLQSSHSRRVVSNLREKLQLTLPSYMVPSRIVAISKMPVNTSGKVDRKELTRRAKEVPRSRGGNAAKAAKNAAPALDSIEAMLCEEFELVFGIKVGPGDHFFQLGGHSLLATKLVSSISRRLHARIFVKEVFDNPVIGDLAVSIRQGLTLNNFVVPTTSSAGNETQAVAARVPPRNELEVILCEEYTDVLGLEVGITDHFFELGGHSLMATKVVARLGHRLNTTISVKDIFDYPVIVDLANKIGLAELDDFDAANGMADLADHVPFDLLSVQDPEAFVQREICPLLEYSYDEISDVYPTTQTQSTFLIDHIGKPIPPTPFYFDFPVNTDCARLIKACKAMVEYVDIFRTVFVVLEGSLYQVVLKQLDLDVKVVETDENVNKASLKFLDNDLKTPLVFGKPVIRATILMNKGSFVRVILQLSHALYDGLSLEHIVQTLHLLYSGNRDPDRSQFSRYMNHLVNSRKDGYDFWRPILENSTILDSQLHNSNSDLASRPPPEAAPGNRHAIKVIDVPAKTNQMITAATIFTTASALALSQDSGMSDVLFGRIVSGRQGMSLNCQNMIGPCTNVVPVRARVDANTNYKELLQEMQDQYLSSIPYETLGFEELKRNCNTGWPEKASKFGCCIVYQQFDYRPSSQVDGETIQIGNLVGNHADSNAPLHDLLIGGEVNQQDRTVQITIVANRQICDEARVNRLLDDVCQKILGLMEAL